MAVKKKNNAVEADSNSEQDKPEAKPGFDSYLRVFTYADNIGRGLYAISFIAAIAAGTTLPLMNIVFGSFVTTFTRFASGNISPAGYMRQVEKLALYFVYLFIAKFALTYIHTVCVSLAAIRTTKALRVHFLQSLLRQEIAFFESKDIGSPSIKVTTNGNIINNGISEKLTLTISNLALFFSAFVVAFAVQWKLTLITIGIIPVLFVAVGSVFALDAPIEARVMAAYTRAALLAEEVFSTIPTVHAFWLQPLMAQRYDSHLGDAEREGMKKSPIFGVLFSASYFCVYSGYGLAFWQGTRMYVSGEITEAGKIVTVIFALVLAATSVQSIAFQTMVVSKAVTAAGELFAVIDRESAIDSQSGTGLRPDTCRGNIEVRDLCFAYPSRPDSRVLNHLTVNIPANKTTALVGASGCGKSTIVGLLERWYDYLEGAIYLDGVNIREVDVKWLRTKIRLVQQEPVLFSGTVFDNVCHGLIGTEHEHASDEHKMELVRDACQAAFAHDFIEQLPNGYFAELGDRARMLSGGQKQRIAIARAIISNPPVLLLDEATSALDPRAEKVVQKALDNVSKSRTTLVIAHKLSTVQKADNIAVMAQGAVIEQGTSASLMELNGAYARLVRAQNLEQGAAGEGLHSTEVPPGDGDAHDMSDAMQEKLAPRATNESSGKDVQYDESGETLFREGMNYSLLKCLFLLVREQRRLWPLYFVLGVASLCAGGTWPVLAILFSRMFVTFQLNGSAATKEGNFWALMFFVVALANFAIYFTIGIVANVIGQKVTHRYRLETFNDIIRQDLAFFDQETNATGAITSRLSTCPTDLTELLGFNSGIILNNVVTVISCAILGIAYGWKLGLVCTFAALPPMLISGYARIRLESKLDDDTVKRFASSASLATEAVSAIRTVASLTFEPTVLRQYEERLSNVASKSGKALIWTMFWYSISQSINFLAMALGFWYGGKLVSTSEYSTGQFFIVFIAIILGGENAAQFLQYSTSITKAQKAANYVFWLRYRIPAIGEEEQAPPPVTEKQRDQPASIACDAVEFAYPSRPHTKVIRGIDFKVPAGSFVAFVGASGSGKSTLISLIARYYDPTSGVIAVNDQSIANIGLRQYRRMLALVQQEPVLYTGTVRENVAMGAVELGEPVEEQIERGLKDANIWDFVCSLPEGLQTPLGSRGAQLSGGQKQRIAIARSLIRDPKILLLDESTSALDTESEHIVQAALMEAAKDGRRSTIAVAHRLSTVKDADTIYVFHAGRIVESGTHGELIARKGIYFDMAQGQALDGP